MAKNIRSEYVRELVEDKNSLDNKLKEVAKSTLDSIMSENIETKLRKIISEDDDKFIEDEVDDDVDTENTDDIASDVSNDDDTVDSDDEEDVDDEIVDNEFETDDATEDPEFDDDIMGDDEEIWNDLEKYKGDDGEYDLTGMDSDNLIKVMQLMKPEDGVRVVKNNNGTITLSDDDTDKEYIIDLDGACDDMCDDECEIEIDDNIGENCQRRMECNEETDLGYTDNFQDKTAMTTPPNRETGKNVRSWDRGVDKGNGKRWANQGNKQPFTEEEEPIYEVELEDADEDVVNETMTTQENGPYARGAHKTHGNNNRKHMTPREGSEEGRIKKGTGESPYSDVQMENIKRKANTIFKENKELKTLVPQLRQRMMEAVVINKSMGNIMKLVMENITTVNEKQEILKRFSDVRTLEESDNLYKTISEELKREGKTMNINNVLNSQLAESKNNIVETPLYQSEDLSKTLDLMSRMNKIR